MRPSTLQPKKGTSSQYGNSFVNNSTYSERERSQLEDPRKALQNPYPRSSLAAKDSILRKEASRLHQESLGLNPNLRVEDEYIENLLKQVHYMNLEINLLKEKQSETKGGVSNIGKDGNPIYDDIIYAENKYEIMRKKLEEEIHELEAQLLKRQDENQALQKLRDDLRGLAEKKEKEFMDYLKNADQKITKLKNDLKDERNSREDIENELNKIRDNVNKLKAENDRLNKEKEKRNLLRKLEIEDLDQDTFEQKDQMEHLQELIKMLKEKEKNVIEKYYENESAKKKKELLEAKTIELHESLKKAARLKVEVEELENSIDFLSQKLEDEKEIKRKLVGELEKYKQLLDDAKNVTKARIVRKMKENANPEIASLNSRIIQAKGDLDRIQNKLEKTQDVEIKCHLEQLKRKQAIYSLEQGNNELQQDLKFYQDNLLEVEPKVLDDEKKLLELQQNYDILIAQRNKKRKEMDKVNEELLELKSRYEYLSSNVDLEAELKAINVDRLSDVVRNNESVNFMIGDLLQNYQRMRQYANQNL